MARKGSRGEAEQLPRSSLLEFISGVKPLTRRDAVARFLSRYRYIRTDLAVSHPWIDVTDRFATRQRIEVR